MHFCFISVVAAMLLASLAGCRIRETASGVKEDGASPPSLNVPQYATAIEGIVASGTDVLITPIVLPSDLYKSMGQDEGSKAARIKLIAGFLKMAAEKIPGLSMQNAVTNSFGITAADLQGSLAANPNADAYAIAAAKIDDKLAQDPTVLDRFPTIPLADLPSIQAALFAKSKPSDTTKPPRAFPQDTAADVTFQAGGCAVPEWKPHLAVASLGLYDSRPLIDAKVVPCFHANNDVLAGLMNRFANAFPGAAGAEAEIADATLHFPQANSVDPGAPGADGTVKVLSASALLKAFSDRGFQIEVFSTRVVADFMGYMVPDAAGAFHPLRLALWIGAKINGKTVRFPAEHGEVGLIIQKNGVRFAQVRYYLGLPDAKYPESGSWWRPHPEKDTLWSGTVHEHVEHFAPGSDLSGATRWLEAVSDAMRGFQAAHDRFHLPAGSYGVFVCSDSLVLASALRQRQDGPLSSRLANIFPIVRAGKQLAAGQPVDADAVVTEFSGMPRAELDAVYPSDQDLYKDAEKFHARLRLAYPAANDGRFAAFPEFQAALKESVDP